jgi:hypothetical protein
MSQKEPEKIVRGKLALKKCRMVNTEATTIPTPAIKLQKRSHPLPLSVKALSIAVSFGIFRLL